MELFGYTIVVIVKYNIFILYNTDMTIKLRPWQQVFVVAMNVVRYGWQSKNSKLYKMSKKFLDRWQEIANKEEMFLTPEEEKFFFEQNRA